ncbi:MAG: DNA polymerase III subunit gamma/tau [Clostridiaceae bacterium]|nr:DNA polymerase III subunit gamma/tau [Clostridiaceae bacterium]
MDNLALYRKYRPLTFSQVIGQNSITSSLMEQVESGRISHAYLFTGTRGTGKTTCAKILARAICCQNPKGGNPCNECPACRAILSGSALDITEIDAASNNGVDNIRDLRQEAMYAPSELRYRVYIIDEVHMLSQGAFNALLKTLEEPPSHVVFILATTELHKVPATILSRCQRYDFRRIPSEIMAGELENIAKRDGFLLDHDAADILAAMGDGSMRDSISLMDRAKGASFHVTAEGVTEALGLASEREIMAIWNAIFENDAAEAVAAFTSCYMTGRDIISIFDNLLSLLRDIYLYKATKQKDYLMSRWRSSVPEMAEQCSVPRLERCIESINFFLGRTTRTSAKRLDGEMCLIKMALPEMPVKPVYASSGDGQTAASLSKAEKKHLVKDEAEQKPEQNEAPPWEDGVSAEVSAISDDQDGPSPLREEYVASELQEKSEATSSSYQKLRDCLEGKVNSAVKIYLKNASVRETDGGIYIEVPEEGLIFIGKPEVLEIISKAGIEAGYTFVKVSKMTPVKKKDPLETIKNRAESLGINVKIK